MYFAHTERCYGIDSRYGSWDEAAANCKERFQKPSLSFSLKRDENIRLNETFLLKPFTKTLTGNPTSTLASVPDQATNDLLARLAGGIEFWIGGHNTFLVTRKKSKPSQALNARSNSNWVRPFCM